MTFRLDLEILQKALMLEIEENMYNIPDEYYSPHKFSKRFERRMKRLQRYANRPPVFNVIYTVAKRVAIIFLAVAIASFTTIMSVEALRIKFLKFVEQKFKEYSAIFYEPDYPTESLNHGTFVAYVPSYIPTGFELIHSAFVNGVTLQYENSTEDFITYRQRWIDEVNMQINTEGTELIEIVVDQRNVKYYENNGIFTVFWDDDEYFYYISTNIDRKTAIKVAENVEIYNS